MTEIPPVSNVARLCKQQLSQNEAVPRLKEDSVRESLEKNNGGRGAGSEGRGTLSSIFLNAPFRFIMIKLQTLSIKLVETKINLSLLIAD